jgi:uncharacterized protein YhfF
MDPLSPVAELLAKVRAAEYAAIEGDDDGSLEYWRHAHWAFFSRESKRIGRGP